VPDPLRVPYGIPLQTGIGTPTEGSGALPGHSQAGSLRHTEAKRRRSQPRTVHTLYISPLKALNYDIERNLRAPLSGIETADLEQLLQPLRSLLDSPWPMRPFRRVRVESWGSGPVPKPVSAALEAVGFIRGHRGLTLAE